MAKLLSRGFASGRTSQYASRPASWQAKRSGGGGSTSSGSSSSSQTSSAPTITEAQYQTIKEDIAKGTATPSMIQNVKAYEQAKPSVAQVASSGTQGIYYAKSASGGTVRVQKTEYGDIVYKPTGEVVGYTKDDRRVILQEKPSVQTLVTGGATIQLPTSAYEKAMTYTEQETQKQQQAVTAEKQSLFGRLKTAYNENVQYLYTPPSLLTYHISKKYTKEPSLYRIKLADVFPEITKEQKIGSALLVQSASTKNIFPFPINRILGTKEGSQQAVGVVTGGYEYIRTKPAEVEAIVASAFVGSTAVGVGKFAISGASYAPKLITAGRVAGVSLTALYGASKAYEYATAPSAFERGEVLGRAGVQIGAFSIGWYAGKVITTPKISVKTVGKAKSTVNYLKRPTRVGEVTAREAYVKTTQKIKFEQELWGWKKPAGTGRIEVFTHEISVLQKGKYSIAKTEPVGWGVYKQGKLIQYGGIKYDILSEQLNPKTQSYELIAKYKTSSYPVEKWTTSSKYPFIKKTTVWKYEPSQMYELRGSGVVHDIYSTKNVGYGGMTQYTKSEAYGIAMVKGKAKIFNIDSNIYTEELLWKSPKIKGISITYTSYPKSAPPAEMGGAGTIQLQMPKTTTMPPAVMGVQKLAPAMIMPALSSIVAVPKVSSLTVLAPPTEFSKIFQQQKVSPQTRTLQVQRISTTTTNFLSELSKLTETSAQQLGLGTGVATAQRVATTTTQRVATTTAQRTATPFPITDITLPAPRIPLFPPIPMEFPIGFEMFGGIKKGKQPLRYQPSLVAVTKNIKGKKPKIITGLELRPIPKGYNIFAFK